MFGTLYLQSAYSMLHNTIPLKDLVERAKQAGYDVVALSDTELHGSVELFRECKKHQIKPVLGLMIKVSHELTDTSFFAYVKSEEGYQNLLNIALAEKEVGLDDDFIINHQQGLMFVSAGKYSLIDRAIDQGDLDLAKRTLLFYQKNINEFYLGLSLDTFHEEMKIAPVLFKLSEQNDVKLLPIHQTSYLEKEDKEVYEALIKIEDEKNTVSEDSDYSLFSKEQLLHRFQDYEYVFDTLSKVFESIDFVFHKPVFEMPSYPLEQGTSKEFLRSLAAVGLKKRLKKNQSSTLKTYQERLHYELSVIEKMGYADYFLIVYDFVKYAKTHDILVGPGRGSAAGSLVAYCLGITNLDPLQYDLLFERFLNPERISMPDIDLDFTDTRRDEVIRYVEGNYGKDHVAQIITFSTMAARAAVRDVGRVLDYPYDYCDKIAKAIPMFSSIEQALKLPELKNRYASEDGVREIIDTARRTENIIRHASVHACGVLITKEPVTAYAPVQYISASEQDSTVSQYSLHPIEDLGLLKMDFLGLKNLTIIESALRIIKNTRGIEMDIDAIPPDDVKTFALLQRGETTGVFQLESAGMKRYLKELKPTVFEDIIAMVALYRPGPMEWIPDYIAGKHGLKKPKYLHSKLEPILNKTYGVAIYQEQIMETARSLAGFTMGEADVLRRAIGKKIPKLLAEQKTKFIEGCVKNGIPAELGAEIFAFIEPFAGYGFNRSHAACYALVGYQTAYLKANYPTEFMAALMTADQEDIDRVPVMIEE